MAEDDRVSAFSRVGIFHAAEVSREFLRFLAKHVEHQMCAMGDVVVQQGVEDAGSMWLVDSGALYVEKDDVIIAELGAGAIFGETAALGVAEKRTCSVVARSSCHLSVLHQQVVMRGLELFPAERQRVLFQALEQKTRRRGGSEASLEKEFVAKLISSSPLFAHTSEAVMMALGAEAQHRLFMKGEVVMRQGAPGESMFVLVSGVVGVYKHSAEPSQTRKSHANSAVPRTRLVAHGGGPPLLCGTSPTPQIPSRVGRIWRSLADAGPNLVELCLILDNSGPCWPKSSQLWPNSVQCRRSALYFLAVTNLV